ELEAAIRAIAAHRWWGVPEDVLRAQVLLDRPDRLFQLVRIVDEEKRAPGLLRDTPEDLFVGACRLGRVGANRQGFGRESDGKDRHARPARRGDGFVERELREVVH